MLKYKINLDWEPFLQNYWQKKPVLIKQAFKNFTDPISADELAGLAMESVVYSRVVSNKNSNWKVNVGPFLYFNQFGETNWTLLVNSVNHWLEKTNALLEPFSCFPLWQFDDLMVSFSTKGGGVGPHIDQYDVFIIQGSGKRFWRVGDKNTDYNEFVSTENLLHIDSFIPIIEDELLAGDMLYIPAGCPHDGYSIEDSLSYSVGFRLPNQQDLLTHFWDFSVQNQLQTKFYQNPDLKIRNENFKLLPNDVSDLKNLLIQFIHSADFEHFLGNHLSENRHILNIEPLESPFSLNEIKQFLVENKNFNRVSGLKMLEINENYFINGEKLLISPKAGKVLAMHSQINKDNLRALILESDFMLIFTQLINEGFWYLDEEKTE